MYLVQNWLSPLTSHRVRCSRRDVSEIIYFFFIQVLYTLQWKVSTREIVLMGTQNLALFPGHFCFSVYIILSKQWNKNREQLGMKLPSWSAPTVRDILIDSQPLGALAPIPRLPPQLSVTCSTLHCTVHWDGTRPVERSGSVLKVRGNHYQYLLQWEHSVLFYSCKGQESGQETSNRILCG